MDIACLEFEKPMKIHLKGQEITVYAFKTEERENIKFGIQAPRGVAIDREEVFLKKKAKQ